MAGPLAGTSWMTPMDEYLTAIYTDGMWSLAGPTASIPQFGTLADEMVSACRNAGWRLVSVPGEPYQGLWIFKREKAEERPRKRSGGRRQRADRHSKR